MRRRRRRLTQSSSWCLSELSVNQDQTIWRCWYCLTKNVRWSWSRRQISMELKRTRTLNSLLKLANFGCSLTRFPRKTLKKSSNNWWMGLITIRRCCKSWWKLFSWRAPQRHSTWKRTSSFVWDFSRSLTTPNTPRWTFANYSSTVVKRSSIRCSSLNKTIDANVGLQWKRLSC